MNGWINPLCSEQYVEHIRKAIDNDLKRSGFAKCRFIPFRFILPLKRLDTPHITRAISFLTVTMPTEVH